MVYLMENNVCLVNATIVGRFQKYLRSIRRGGFFKLENAKQPLSSAFRHKNHVVKHYVYI